MTCHIDAMRNLTTHNAIAAPIAAPIAIAVNGEGRQAAPGITLDRFLADLGLDPGRVAVERNEAVVPRSLHAATVLEPDDRLEIIHFVGGG